MQIGDSEVTLLKNDAWQPDSLTILDCFVICIKYNLFVLFQVAWMVDVKTGVADAPLDLIKHNILILKVNLQVI